MYQEMYQDMYQNRENRLKTGLKQVSRFLSKSRFFGTSDITKYINILVYTCTLFFTILVSHYSYVVLEKRFLKLKSKFSVIHSGLKVK
jgi:peptidoglycan/LPS O-acetylase OafA/YrhL